MTRKYAFQKYSLAPVTSNVLLGPEVAEINGRWACPKEQIGKQTQKRVVEIKSHVYREQ